jgi:hypothetical protein
MSIRLRQLSALRQARQLWEMYTRNQTKGLTADDTLSIALDDPFGANASHCTAGLNYFIVMFNTPGGLSSILP